MIFLKFLAGTIGFLLFVGCSSMKNKADTSKTANASANPSQPKLTKPIARRIWIEPEILENGSVYIEGHWKYLIQKESTWTK